MGHPIIDGISCFCNNRFSPAWGKMHSFKNISIIYSTHKNICVTMFDYRRNIFLRLPSASGFYIYFDNLNKILLLLIANLNCLSYRQLGVAAASLLHNCHLFAHGLKKLRVKAIKIGCNKQWLNALNQWFSNFFVPLPTYGIPNFIIASITQQCKITLSINLTFLWSWYKVIQAPISGKSKTT